MKIFRRCWMILGIVKEETYDGLSALAFRAWNEAKFIFAGGSSIDDGENDFDCDKRHMTQREGKQNND
jgi:hypothetical protein